jgi:hypothetical protein
MWYKKQQGEMMNIKRAITTTAGLALATGLTMGLASTASASTTPTYCTSSFFQKCAAIKITGVSIGTPPGYYPTPAGPVIDVTSSAEFSGAGVQVTDFRLLVDGKLAPEYDTYFGSGSVGVLYGADPGISISTDGYNPNERIPGTLWPVSPGKHVLTTEVIGVNGAVLATSPSYTVAVPAQGPAVEPTLTWAYAPQWTYESYEAFTVSSAVPVILDAPTSVLTFDVPAGVTVDGSNFNDSNNDGTVTQAGNTVTLTMSAGLSLSNTYPLIVEFWDVIPPVAISSVTLDGIPVSLG